MYHVFEHDLIRHPKICLSCICETDKHESDLHSTLVSWIQFMIKDYWFDKVERLRDTRCKLLISAIHWPTFNGIDKLYQDNNRTIWIKKSYIKCDRWIKRNIKEIDAQARIAKKKLVAARSMKMRRSCPLPLSVCRRSPILARSSSFISRDLQSLGPKKSQEYKL